MISNPGSALLYRTATGLEQSMADADAERQIAIHAEAVTEVWDPFKISLENLPYLAWGMGVNFWVDNWSETTKRNWTARQLEFKSLRGKLSGIRMAVDFAGRDVTPFGYSIGEVTVPPQKIFSGASLTVAQREHWLAGLPQLRVWRVNEAGVAEYAKAFYGGQAPDDRLHNYRFCLGGGASILSTAMERLKRRARWVVNGVETDITVNSIGSYWQLHLPGSAGERVFTDRPIRPDRFYVPSEAWRRIVTIAPNSTLAWRSVVGPTLEPISSIPERIVVDGTRGYSVFCDLPSSPKSYYAPSMAPLRIYQRYAVNDGSPGAMARRPAVQFMGVGRYGFPKYTAWVGVAINGLRSAFAAGEGIIASHRRYWIPHDPMPLRRVREAVSCATRLADKVLLRIGPVPRFIAGGTPMLADIDQMIVGRP